MQNLQELGSYRWFFLLRHAAPLLLVSLPPSGSGWSVRGVPPGVKARASAGGASWGAELIPAGVARMMSCTQDCPAACGSSMVWRRGVMDFYAMLDQVLDLLRQCGRLSYRALTIQFTLDDNALEALKEELIEVHQCAVDQDGKMLVWTGDTASPAVLASIP